VGWAKRSSVRHVKHCRATYLKAQGDIHLHAPLVCVHLAHFVGASGCLLGEHSLSGRGRRAGSGCSGTYAQDTSWLRTAALIQHFTLGSVTRFHPLLASLNSVSVCPICRTCCLLPSQVRQASREAAIRAIVIFALLNSVSAAPVACLLPPQVRQASREAAIREIKERAKKAKADKAKQSKAAAAKSAPAPKAVGRGKR
jgi:hypothetical protein